MREIKFRVWDTAEKQPMIYFGSDFHLDDDNDTISFDAVNGTKVLGDNNVDGKRFILMQYTGLKDKNGKEIYSGDILFNEVKNGVVQWSDKYMDWMSSEIHKMDGEGVYEVIGNIYEHPDLLKSSEGDIM